MSMSYGRDKLKQFSLLKSLISGKKLIQKSNSLFQNREVLFENRRKNKISEYSQSLRTPQYCKKNVLLQKEIDNLHQEEMDPINIYVNVTKRGSMKDFTLWISKAFPLCFNKKNIKPLKIGINLDIEMYYLNKKSKPIDSDCLNLFLKKYINNINYQKSILKHKERYDLYGHPVEKIADLHLKHAEKKLSFYMRIKNKS